MTIATTAAKVISDAELARANALETTASTQAATITAQAAEIARLTALVAPPPPPPPPARTGLYVDAGKLRTRFGAELRLRVIEVMVVSTLKSYGYGKFLAQIKNDLGANAVAPLFEGSLGVEAEVKAFCDAALALNMTVFVNADHQYNFAGGTQGWADEPWLAALMNTYPHVILECDVETDLTSTGGDASLAAWVTAEKAKVKKFRDAGHTSPIKIGAHGGGRDVRYPLASGAEVLAFDPLKKCVFTFQAYWKAALGGTWYYQWGNKANGGNFSDGVAGTQEALAACAASGLVFVPGFDFKDNVGLTGEAALIQTALSLGLSHAHWAATGDTSNSENNVYDWDFKPGPLSTPPTAPKPTAAMLAAAWLPARAAFPDPAL